MGLWKCIRDYLNLDSKQLTRVNLHLFLHGHVVLKSPADTRLFSLFTSLSEHRVALKHWRHCQKSSEAPTPTVGGTSFSTFTAQEIGKTGVDSVSEGLHLFLYSLGSICSCPPLQRGYNFALSLQCGFNSVSHTLPPTVPLCYILEVRTSSIIFNDLFGIFQPDRK